MKFFKTTILFAGLLAGSGPSSGAALERFGLSRVEPGSCSDLRANPPASVNAFLTTDTEFYLWFVVTGGQTGDVAASEYRFPDGRLYTDLSGAWDPVPSAGDRCFIDLPFRIAGAIPAGSPGKWTVRVTYKGQTLFTAEFTISAPSSTSGPNLILNPAADLGAARADCAIPSSIPNWQTADGFTVCVYNNLAIDVGDPGPPGRGANFFSGGTSTAKSTARQTINLSASAAAIDAGTQGYTLSGWLGGWQGQNDNARVTATFKSGSGLTLGSAVIGPVLAAERGGRSGLVQKSASGTVPKNSRSAEILMEMTRTEGSYNDAAADSLSFTLSAVSGGGAIPPPSCSYSLNATGASALSTGLSSTVLVTASAANCAWTAQSKADWITITAGASRTGNGSVNYTAAANSAPQSRAGTMTIAGITFTVTQAAAALSGAPSIGQGGVVNAASYMPANLPGGAIAQGSFFSIFGSGLGPDAPAQAGSYPLAATLGEVSIAVSKGSERVQAYPVFVSRTQLNAVMPSNAPLGDAQVTVTFRGRSSAPMAIKTAVSNFGAFSTANGRGPGIFQNYVSQADQPLNTRSVSARPGQVVTLWGTGLGPITASDNTAPPAGNLPVAVEIYAGSYKAKKLYSGRAPCCAGVDQIVFELPPETPSGCSVPVQVKAGTASFSNTVTLAVDGQGRACSDPQNPFGDRVSQGGKNATIFLLRASILAQLEAGAPPLDLLLDLALGVFQETTPLGDLGFNPLSSLPPVGACTAYTGEVDAAALLGAGLGGLPGDSKSLLGRQLDAGKELRITGPLGNSIAMARIDEEVNTGPYVGLLGGELPIDGAPSLPPFLDGGAYQISGGGGLDVGAFSANVTLAPPIRWTNRDQVSAIDRSQGLRLTWTGGSPSTLVLIGGIGNDQSTKATAGFLCFVPSEPGSFTVPAPILGNLPAVSAQSSNTLGAIVVGGVPAQNIPRFRASGIDSGMVIFSSLSLKTVAFR